MPLPFNEFKPKYPPSLGQQVAEFLTSSIIEGKLKPGERLVEVSLQRELGVSRAPIREAFRECEKNGLIIIVPREGAFVRKVNQEDVKENLSIRAILEGYAARLAIENLDDLEIEKLELTYKEMKKATGKRDFNLSDYLIFCLPTI